MDFIMRVQFITGKDLYILGESEHDCTNQLNEYEQQSITGIWIYKHYRTFM